MTSYALLFTLSAIGISETAYLVKKRITFRKPACPIGDKCALVLASKYNKIFLIHNDTFGLLFYIMASVMTAFLVIGVEPLAIWSFIFRFSVLIGVIISLFLTYLQWRVIQVWCFWCLMSAFTIWLMGLILILILINPL